MCIYNIILIKVPRLYHMLDGCLSKDKETPNSTMNPFRVEMHEILNLQRLAKANVERLQSQEKWSPTIDWSGWVVESSMEGLGSRLDDIISSQTLN